MTDNTLSIALFKPSEDKGYDAARSMNVLKQGRVRESSITGLHEFVSEHGKANFFPYLSVPGTVKVRESSLLASDCDYIRGNISKTVDAVADLGIEAHLYYSRSGKGLRILTRSSEIAQRNSRYMQLSKQADMILGAVVDPLGSHYIDEGYRHMSTHIKEHVLSVPGVAIDSGILPVPEVKERSEQEFSDSDPNYPKLIYELADYIMRRDYPDYIALQIDNSGWFNFHFSTEVKSTFGYSYQPEFSLRGIAHLLHWSGRKDRQVSRLLRQFFQAICSNRAMFYLYLKQAIWTGGKYKGCALKYLHKAKVIKKISQIGYRYNGGVVTDEIRDSLVMRHREELVSLVLSRSVGHPRRHMQFFDSLLLEYIRHKLLR